MAEHASILQQHITMTAAYAKSMLTVLLVQVSRSHQPGADSASTDPNVVRYHSVVGVDFATMPKLSL